MKTRSKNLPDVAEDPPMDDSEPEEVCFDVGKQEATLALKNISIGIKAQKDKTKRHRTKIHERNATQKQLKLARLEKRKLPEDFLEMISAIPDEQLRNSNKKSIVPKKQSNSESSDSSEEVDMKWTPEDFISIHGNTEFRVVALPKEIRKPVSIATSAAEFKQKMLNRKGIQRESVKEMLSRNAKQAVKCGSNTFVPFGVPSI